MPPFLFSPTPRWQPSPLTKDRVLLALERRLRQPVRTGADELVEYAKDESGAGEFLPDIVVKAENRAEVQAVLEIASADGVPVTPRGAGSGKSGGCLAVAGGIVLVLSEMKAIRHIDVASNYAVVEPGLITGDFQAAVESQGRFYPPDPASLSWCSLGGNVAENAGGPRAFKYGVTRDYVMGLEVVLPSGELLSFGRKAGKGVVGYDLTGLFTGSEGTLGVITEITLKLVAQPAVVETALMTFGSLREAADAITDMGKKGLTPRTLELLDRAALSAIRATAVDLFPDHVQAALIVEVDGPEVAVLPSLAEAAEIADNHGGQTVVAKDDAQRQRIWATRRQVSEALRRMARHKLSEDVAVPRGRVPELIDRVAEIAEREGLRHASYGHAGDGNLHVNYLWDDDSEEPAVSRALEATYRAAVALDGTISGEHGVGLVKREYVGIEQSDGVIGLQRRLKQLLDPTGILNPGKMFPSERNLLLNRS